MNKKSDNKSKDIKKLKEKAAKRSIIEGGFATTSSSFGGSYVSPFAIATNATNSQIAMLQSIPGLLGPLSQWMSSRLIEKYSRKRIVLLSVLFEALIWLPVILLSYLFYKGIFVGYIPLMLIIFISMQTILSGISGPAWFSWMGDLIENKKRGNYFSKRSRIIQFVSITTTIISGFFLDFFKNHGILILGFSTFFFIAMTARLISRHLIKGQYEPKIKLERDYYFSFGQFVKKMRYNNFGRFTIFRAFLSFSVMVAGPFFTIYMLKNLGFSYITFTIVTISQTVFSMLVLPLWGKFSDKYGNYKTMKITSVIIFLIPLPWIFIKSPILLILIPMLISGIGWAGFDLAVNNFIYDSVTPQRRGLCVAYFNVVVGFGVFLGAGLGGLLAAYLPLNSLNIILGIFLISSILRFLTVIIFLPKVKEVRQVKNFDTNRRFTSLLHRTINNLTEPISEIISLKKFNWKRKN